MTRHEGQIVADELAANVAVPFNRATAMPKSVYTSPEFLALEQERIFGRDWICAGRAESIPNVGDYVTMELAGEPIVVIRDRDNTLRAMSNVCRHRMSTLLQGRGNVRAIVCPYHAWTYNLDGSLRGAPGMTLNEGFCRSDIRLPTVRCEVWQGWVMVTLDPDAPSPAEALGDVAGLIAPLDMSAYRQTFGQQFRWKTNWKVLAENFMESYHLPVCHAGTIGGASKLEEMVCPEGYPSFNYHWILKDDSVPLALAHPSNTVLTGDQRRTTWLLAIYPSLLITLTPGYFWYLSLTPTADPGEVDVMFGGGMSPEWLADPEAEAHLDKVRALLDDVNIEDKGCTEKVYRGLKSKLGAPGALSHLERPNFEFAQYLNRRMQG